MGDQKMLSFLLVRLKYNKLELYLEVEYENMPASRVDYIIPDLPASRCVYTGAQTRKLDRIAIETGAGAQSGFELMCRAGRAAFRVLRARWLEARHVLVSCGGGNNGGDGLVIAGLAVQQGLKVTLRALFDPERLRGEAAQAWQWARARGVQTVLATQALPDDVDVVVDALLGTGLEGDVRAEHAAELRRLAGLGTPVLAVDIPSGLHADTGRLLGPVVPADVTVTFIGVKRGLVTGQGPGVTGDLIFDPLGVTDEVYAQVPSDWRLVNPSHAVLPACLARRSPVSHKGHFGRVLCVGGNHGMGGALFMAAGAACRSGAGLVAAVTRPEHVGAGLTQWPEVQYLGSDDPEAVGARLEWADVCVIGPGLGRDEWARALLHKVIEQDTRLVLDADALNLMASDAGFRPSHHNWLATPHPAEAARLLSCAVSEVQADRFAAIEALHERYGGHWLLKGAGPLWLTDTSRGVVASAHAVLAKGGSGDVLSGMLGALWAQDADIGQVVMTALILQAQVAGILETGQAAFSATASDQIEALCRIGQYSTS